MKKAILLITILALGTLIFSQPLTQVGLWEYGPTEAVAVKDSTAYISSGSYLWVLDISDESNISLIDEIKLENYINYIRRIGNYLYVSKEDTILNIYDIHTANSPSLVNQLHGVDTDYPWEDLFIENDTLWICGYWTYEYYLNDTVNIVNTRYTGYGDNFYKQDTLSIACEDDRFRVFKITGTSNIGSTTDLLYMDENIRGLYLNYPFGYFGYGSRGIGIMDISNIYNIDLHSTINTNGYTYDIELIEDTIMIATRGLNGIGVYDVENDTTFTLIGECDTDGFVYEIEVIGDRLYVGARSGGLIIIDISDKSNPTVLGEYQGYGECRRMDIDGNRLYSASGDGGLMIMDITNRTNPTVIGQCYTKDIAEDVVKEGSYVYIADGENGLTVINITDENNPSVVSFVPITYYCQQVDVMGQNCAVGGWVEMDADTFNNGIGLIDVTDPVNPNHISNINKGHNRMEFEIADGYLHTVSNAGVHPRYAIWDINTLSSPYIRDSIIGNIGVMKKMTVDNDTTIFEYGSTEIEVYDLTDIDNILHIDSIQKSTWTSCLDRAGSYLYEADYYNNLKVWDISDVSSADTISWIKVKDELNDIKITSNIIYTAHNKYGISIFSFSPAGIEDNNNQINADISIISTLNAIQIQNNTNTTQTYQITDITGRVIDDVIVKQGLNTYTPQQSGIYFVINKSKNIIGKAIIVR